VKKNPSGTGTSKIKDGQYSSPARPEYLTGNCVHSCTIKNTANCISGVLEKMVHRPNMQDHQWILTYFQVSKKIIFYY
jgi:hypothetical protein